MLGQRLAPWNIKMAVNVHNDYEMTKYVSKKLPSEHDCDQPI